MNITFSEKLIAYLTLISGLSLSSVAVYYSVIGLTAIFSAAVIPIIVMGVTLEISKLVATIWLKQNWSIAPKTIKSYLIIAIAILMLITSMGIFGFLSKAHNDQTLVSGDVLSKIAVYDEKIKIAKDNIDANRKALKQLDEAVDQVMARSTTEQGADKAVQVRRQQSKERARLLQEIQTEQKKISQFNEERAPIAAEVRKVEAEVGPLKYIATFIYGDTDKTILEKSVTWIIIIIVLVFDPLAVVLLLASQFSFQYFRKVKSEESVKTKNTDPVHGETDEWKEDISEVENSTPGPTKWNEDNFDINDHPYLFKTPSSYHPPGITPVSPQVYKENITTDNFIFPEILENDLEEKLFVQNEEQTESNLWTATNTVIKSESVIDENDYRNISKEKLEEIINHYADLLREKRIAATNIPKDIIQEVKARV